LDQNPDCYFPSTHHINKLALKSLYRQIHTAHQ
jgi:hypothetical protein